MSKGRWINSRVVLDMTTGAVLEREGFFYVGPLALAEGEPDLAKLQADLAAATKVAEEAVAEAAKLRKTNSELSGKVITPEQQKRLEELEAAAAKAEEDRKAKAGEWDNLKNDLVTKHQTELKEREERLGKTSERLRQTAIFAEFGRASELFGDAGKTIFDVDMGVEVLGKYVHLEDDENDPRGYRVVVKKANGTPVMGADGNPLPFAAAMTELIGSLPNKDRILRGSGKTGSGSSGGGHHNPNLTDDLDALTKKAAAGDKEALAALKQRQAGLGGAIQGTAYAAAASKK